MQFVISLVAFLSLLSAAQAENGILFFHPLGHHERNLLTVFKVQQPGGLVHTLASLFLFGVVSAKTKMPGFMHFCVSFLVLPFQFHFFKGVIL